MIYVPYLFAMIAVLAVILIRVIKRARIMHTYVLALEDRIWVLEKRYGKIEDEAQRFFRPYEKAAS